MGRSSTTSRRNRSLRVEGELSGARSECQRHCRDWHGPMSSPDPSGLQKLWAQRTSKHAQVLLKGLSITAGLFLLVAGTVGLSAIVFLQLVYFIGSIYTIFFGLL